MEVDAQAVMTTVLCKAPGCGEDAAWAKGMYAGLCKRHADEKGALRMRVGGASPVEERTEVPIRGKGARADAVRGMYLLARKIDGAEKRRDKAIEELAKLKREWTRRIAGL